MITVIRYSKTGFKPRYQDHHLHHVLYELTEFDVDEAKRSPHAKAVLEIHERRFKLFKENFDDFRYGVWCFKEGASIGPELNHLREARPRWEAELPEDIEVYDVNLDAKYLLKDFPYGAMYVPRRSLKQIANVHRVHKKCTFGVA